MTIEPIIVKDKIGRQVLLRAATREDSADLINYLKVTSGEATYLIRDTDEITITLVKEDDFIQDKFNSGRELKILAFVDGKYVGNCAFKKVEASKRSKQRCELAVAL